MPFTKDLLLHPSPEEKRKHKCLVLSPNSYFTDVKCPGCYKIAVFGRAQTVVCVGCSTVCSAHSRKKQGLQEDAPSERSNIKSTMNRVRNHSNKHFGYKK